MQKLIDLTKGEKSVFVHLNNAKEMSDFLKQAEAEGFMIGSKLPTQCKCESVMILHDNYTILYLHGFVINAAYDAGDGKKVDYTKVIKN